MNYPMQSSGLGGLNTVQNMSDRNMMETLMANGGQRFATGGISNIPRMAAGGVPKYTYDPITGKYTQVDAATAASSDVPKYTYDPVTQRYTLDTSILEKKKEDTGSGGSNEGNDPNNDPFPGWSGLSNSEKASYFADPKNSFEATVRGLAQKGFGVTALGRAQNLFDPTIQSREASITAGIDPDTGLQGQGTRGQTGLHGDFGVFDRSGNLMGYSPEAQYGFTAEQPGSAAPDSGPPGADPSSDSGRDAGNSGSAPGGGAAAGGLMALAQGGMSNLGDYSDGGRLLRGPGDGVSDSIPATIANKQPARLADGEFVVPARIVSELGNGSTEAGARKLYQMLARVQNARKKSIGQGRVAVNSRAEKLLPA